MSWELKIRYEGVLEKYNRDTQAAGILKLAILYDLTEDEVREVRDTGSVILDEGKTLVSLNFVNDKTNFTPAK